MLKAPSQTTAFLEKIVSGGQTGVDRAALDAAWAVGLPVGGWCPQGRRAEDGRVPEAYPLRETPSPDYAQRTAWNVRDSDGTLILVRGAVLGGTALTRDEAQRQGRPCVCCDFAESVSVEAVRRWLAREAIRVLNVAGPRQSEAPGLYEDARRWLVLLFQTRQPGG